MKTQEVYLSQQNQSLTPIPIPTPLVLYEYSTFSTGAMMFIAYRQFVFGKASLIFNYMLRIDYSLYVQTPWLHATVASS